MKFILDENISYKIAKGFIEFGEELYSTEDIYEPGLKDSELLGKISKDGYYLITRDKMYKKPAERKIIRDLGISIFRIETKGKAKNLKYWELIKLLVFNWEEIKKFSIGNNEPFTAIISQKNVKHEKFQSSHSNH